MKRVVVDPISRIEGRIVFWYCLARYRTCC